MSAVRLEGAVVLLGRFPALAGADFAVDSGEVVLVRGPNGAGKSTMLHLCAGLLPLSEGRGEVLGSDLGSDRAAVRRRVGLLGHDTALYGELSAVENLDLWARASRVDAVGVPGALRRLGVPERLWAFPSARLSAGQRRRVALAAIVVRRPELWLLDEPHAGLDSEGRELVSGLMSKAAAAGAAVVLASHEPGPADDLATRTVTMAGGTVRADAA
ncbi:MAG: heme ABC exporter ATP-binding protein CcmA [Acidimicrobiia bacterium]|nr:heme ABC exporter ATP-binding protein CcmA [Acidimicrobiia bacterium]